MGREGPETKLVKKMLTEAKRVYGERQCFFKHHGSAMSKAGVSDLIGTLDGVFVACEVKAPESYGNSVERALDEGPTPNQREYIRKVNAAGGIGFVAATVEGWMLGLANAVPHAYDGDTTGPNGEEVCGVWMENRASTCGLPVEAHGYMVADD